jgi:hypothetical protein
MEPEGLLLCSQEESNKPDESHLCLGLPSGLFPFSFLTVLCMNSPAMRTTCHTHLIVLDLIIVIMFAEEYKF